MTNEEWEKVQRQAHYEEDAREHVRCKEPMLVHDQALYARVTRLEATVKRLKEWIDDREEEMRSESFAERERSE